MERTITPELLDSNDIPQAELNANLADMARLNRLSGTTGALCRHVFDLAAGCTTFSVLDVGAGSGDMSDVLSETAIRQRRRCLPIAIDVHPGVLHSMQMRHPRLAALQSNGIALPLASQSVDIAICVQTLHHLDGNHVICFLQELCRVSRIGFLVMDLERGRLAALAATVLTRLLSQNRLTLHDGPLSARRAYRASEAAALGARAGLALEFQSLFPFRWMAVYKRIGE